MCRLRPRAAIDFHLQASIFEVDGQAKRLIDFEPPPIILCSRVGIPLCRWSPGVSRIFGCLGAGFVLIYTRIAYQSRLLLSFVYYSYAYLVLPWPCGALYENERRCADHRYLVSILIRVLSSYLVLFLLTKLRRTQVVW